MPVKAPNTLPHIQEVYEVMVFELSNWEFIQGGKSSGNLMQYPARIFLRKCGRFFGLCSKSPSWGMLARVAVTKYA